jgi:hypothetical protein
MRGGLGMRRNGGRGGVLSFYHFSISIKENIQKIE